MSECNHVAQQARSNKSESIGNLVAALAKAHQNFSPAVKSSKNPQFSSTYADLSTLIEATQPALDAEGLTVLQFPVSYLENSSGVLPIGESDIGVKTIIAHESGEWIEETFIVPMIKRQSRSDGGGVVDSRDPQAMGSALTYGRRYGYAAVTGIPQVDDDGEGAMGRGASKKARPSSSTPSPSKKKSRGVPKKKKPTKKTSDPIEAGVVGVIDPDEIY